MKSWLKFFGLSFFSDKIAKEARTRGVLNCVLGFILALIFIFCGVLAANGVPFYAHYKNAGDFREFVSHALGQAELYVADGLVSSETVINTYENEQDAANYGLNGYNLVVDTRPATALSNFKAYGLSKDGTQKIDYEEYLGKKDDYDFIIEYSAAELVLTDALVAGYEEYLNACENADIKKQYASVKENKASVTAEEYQKSVYALYIHAYYPEITKYERSGEVPLLRTYYYNKYLNDSKTEKCLVVFDDVLFGYYQTGGGLSVSFYGSNKKIKDGAITADGADAFIKKAFGSASKLRANVYLLNIVRFIPLIAAMPLVLALIAMIALMLLKDEKYKKFTTCLKIEFSYLAGAALLTALISFILGFFLSSAAVNSLPLIILAGTLAVRTVVFIVGEYFAVKKTKTEETAVAAE